VGDRTSRAIEIGDAEGVARRLGIKTSETGTDRRAADRVPGPRSPGLGAAVRERDTGTKCDLVADDQGGKDIGAPEPVACVTERE